MSIFKRTCDRCGEKFYPDEEPVFEVRYKTLGYLEDGGETVTREIELCEHCQKELRNEFYRRGLMKHG